MKFRLLLSACLALAPLPAFAQSNPGWAQGFVPPANGPDINTGKPGWNDEWTAKADAQHGILTYPVINNGVINATTIGTSTPASGAFTTITGNATAATANGVALGTTQAKAATALQAALLGVANGVASLDANGLVPIAQMPITQPTTGTTAGTVAAGNDARIVGAVQAAGGNASATTVLASGNTSRALAARLGEIPSIADFGGVCGSDATAALSRVNTAGATAGLTVHLRPCASGWGWSFTRPPAGVLLDAEGPNANQSLFGLGASTTFSQGLYATLAGNHPSTNATVGFDYASPVGSACAGANCADFAHMFRVIKQSWATTQVGGELDGAYIGVYNGGPTPTSIPTKSPTGGLVMDVSCITGLGFCGAAEEKTTTYTAGGAQVSAAMDVQRGVIDPYDGNTFGVYYNLNQGTGTQAVWVTNNTAPAWANATVYAAYAIVTNAGNVYQLGAAGGTASVAPTHTTGTVTGADSLTWTWLRAGTGASEWTEAFQNTRNGTNTILLDSSGVAHFQAGAGLTGAGNPNGNITSTVDGFTCRTDGGPGNTCYVKETGTGNTGWAAVDTANALNSFATAGTTQGTAYVLTTRNTIFTTVTPSNSGAQLTSARQGDQVVVNNSSSQLPLSLYPVSGAAINALGANAAMTVPYGYAARCHFASSAQSYCVAQPWNGGSYVATAASYTLPIASCGGTILVTAATAITYTIPTGLPVGCKTEIIQEGAGAITFAGGSGMTAEEYASGTKSYATLGQFAKAIVLIDSASTFHLSGNVQ